MKYIKLFENNTNNFKKYLDKFCILYFGINLYLVHVKDVFGDNQIKFSYYLYDEDSEKVLYDGSFDIGFKSFNPIVFFDTYKEAEEKYLILLNSEKYNI